ncbi:trehalose-6-phosphate synthase [Chloroflexota bacterium]
MALSLSQQAQGSFQLVELCQELLAERRLIIISNRGPIEYDVAEGGVLQSRRGGSGVVAALSALSRDVEVTWISSTMREGDRRAASSADNGCFKAPLPGQKLYLRFINSPRAVYHKYYNIFCNPLLWFLHHCMWNSPYTPNFDARVYDAWENGYIPLNRAFAEAAIDEAARDRMPPFVMLHDYHLYLAGSYIRRQMPYAILQHFIHVPWPAPDHWQMFPSPMCRAILESLCSMDIVGLQTSRDVQNFLHCCEVFLDNAEVNYQDSIVSVAGHETRVKSYPVSIDIATLQRTSQSPRVQGYEQIVRPFLGEQTIVRVDHAEPSKNIIRGLKAFDMLLERHAHFKEKVRLICFIVPSRSGVKLFQRYTQDVFELVDAINAKHGSEAWKPVKVFHENNYAQVVAGMQLYDVLLVNPIADGMGLAAKQGSIVNTRDGVLILSEAAGAHEQLKDNVLSVAPADIEGTTQALYTALTMDSTERKKRAEALRRAIEQEDITRWLYHQFQDLKSLACQLPLLLPV